LCPSDQRKSNYGIGPKSYLFSYSINSWITYWSPHFPDQPTPDLDKASSHGFPMNWFSRPTKTIALVDQATGKDEIPKELWEQISINDQIFVNIDRSTVRHNGSGKMVFLDGHVKAMKGPLIWKDAKYPDGTFIFHEEIGDFFK
jgi:prepilin-type processing-associated H-X9-DG protein